MKTLVLIAIAYLLGSIPTGLWTEKFFYRVNLREHGGGNTGVTNTFRVLESRAGAVTFITDILERATAILFSHILGVTTVFPMLIRLLAIIGHTFLIFVKFKGGEAVTTSAGVFLGLMPMFLLYLLIIFVGILCPLSMIFLSSVVVAAVVVVSVLILPTSGFLLPHYDLLFTLIIMLIAGIIIARHKDNIIRIRKREENLVPWGLNLSKQKVD